MYKIYLCKPLSGHSFEWAKEYMLSMTEFLKELGYCVLHPLVAKEYLKGEENLNKSGYTRYPPSTDQAITMKDFWSVKQADVVLLDLSGVDKISIGCMFELAWAFALQKLIIVVMEPGNVHEHAFVKTAYSIRYNNIDDTKEYLHKLIKTEF